MAGQGRDLNPDYRGIGSNQNFVPGNVLDESDPDAVTRAQMNEKYHHLRRVAEGRSELFLRKHGADEVFGDVYPEFLSLYSRGQLQHLEKLFLMADQDEDLQLNPFELTYWMEKQNNPISQQELKQIFLLADEDKDGLLSFREFLLFCQKINLKNIPEDTAHGVPGGSAKDPAGTLGQSGAGCSGKHYPPGHFLESHQKPDTGPTKLRNAVLPQIQEHGKLNLNNAIQFFETEIARETEAGAKNRQVNVDLFKHKKKRRQEAMAASTEIPKTYRTTVTMEIKATPAPTPATAQEESLHIQPRLATTTYKRSLADLNLKGHGQPPPPPPMPPIPRQHATLHKETQAPCVAEVLETLDDAKTIETVDDGISKPSPGSALPPVPPPLPLPPPRTPESKPSKEILEQVQLVEPLVTTPPFPPTTALSIPTQTELQIMLSSEKPEVVRVDQSSGPSSIHLPDPPLPSTAQSKPFRNSITSTESLEFLTPIQSSSVLLPRPQIQKNQ